MKRFATLALLLGLAAGAAEARVYSLSPTQTLLPYVSGQFHTPKVAIDGDAIIVLAERAGGRSALLFRRGADGTWAPSTTLLDVNGGDITQSEVAMADGVAAVKLDATMHVFERNAAGQWLESAVAGTPQPGPGLAVSGARIVAGRRCSFDADVHEKSTGSGVWRVVARLTTGLGAADCDHRPALSVSGAVVLINTPADAYEFRRASASSWPLTSTFAHHESNGYVDGPFSVEGDTAVNPGGAVFRRALGVWSYASSALPLNYPAGWGSPRTAALSDGVLRAIHDNDSIYQPMSFSFLYRPIADGQFEQAAALWGYANAETHAYDAGTAVVGTNDFGSVNVEVYELPAPATPGGFVNDFEARDVTGFRQTPGSAFQLTFTGTNTNGAQYVYRQASTAGESRAVFGGDWVGQQYVEADITPTVFDGNDRWFGLGLRYVDDNNFYYATLRSSGRVQIKRMLNGVFTTLADDALPIGLYQKHKVRFLATGDRLVLRVDDNFFLETNDGAHKHGRSALMTNRTQADFDNVVAGSTLPFVLASTNFGDFRDNGAGLQEDGGRWDSVTGPDDEGDGLMQLSTDGDARGTSGPFVTDQYVGSSIRLDQSGSSPSGTWFGLLARYVDARTHYYLSVRSTGQLQIRKQVDGVITVLATAPFTVNPGEFHHYGFSAIGNELHAYVDGRLVAGALDGAIPRGSFGVGMYRTAVTIGNISASQP